MLAWMSFSRLAVPGVGVEKMKSPPITLVIWHNSGRTNRLWSVGVAISVWIASTLPVAVRWPVVPEFKNDETSMSW